MTKFILIVDDSPTIRASAEFTLTEAGFEIREAEHGQDALEKLDLITSEGDKVAMILCDINMPVMDGITFIKEVKQTKHRFIPVLVLSTETQESKKLEGKKAGAAGWLSKPFKPEQLVSVVKRFVR